MGQVRMLDQDEAWIIGSQAREDLVAAGEQASICVINRDGRALFQVTFSEIRSFTTDVAFIKSVLSAETGYRTSTLRDKRETGECLDSALSVGEDEPIWAGGVPIYDGDKNLLGAIGISNLSQEDDEAFAVKAVEAAGFISDRQ